MVRCAGCGEAVSLWAARCPSCGRSTDDAEDLPEPEPEPILEPTPDPESEPDPDPEPDPEPALHAPRRGAWRTRRTRRLLVAAGVTGLVAYGGVIGGLQVTSGARGAGASLPRYLRALPGQVVGMTATGTLAIGPPDNVEPVQLVALGGFRGNTLALSPSGLYLTDTAGQLIDTGSAQMSLVPGFSVVPQGSVAVPDPFADNNEALVETAPGSGTTTAVFVQLVSGPLGGLGTGDVAAGDPKGLGAFVSVLSPVQPSTVPPEGLGGQADSEVQLRELSGSVEVLATAVRLDRAVGETAIPLTHLGLYPSPTGDDLAVVLDPLTAGTADAAMVVLDRRGRVVDSVKRDMGPTEYVSPSWSPDGRSLVWTTNGPGGTGVAVWHPGGALVVRQAPDSTDQGTGCMWSPDGNTVLCGMTNAAPQATAWLFAPAMSGPMYLVGANGENPVAWLAAPHVRERDGQLTGAAR